MEKVDQIKAAVKKELILSSHDFDHVMRVYELGLSLAMGQDVNIEILKPAILLHDIARLKEDMDQSGKTDHALLGAKMAEKILKKMNYSSSEINKIKNCIVSHRYRTGNKPQTIEAKILFDADKLDSIGAIGIVRSFAWACENKAKIYDEYDIDEYIKNNLGKKIDGKIQDKTLHSPFIEYQTKIRFLARRMYTKRAKEIAQERLKYFKGFLDRLEQEIKGKL